MVPGYACTQLLLTLKVELVWQEMERKFDKYGDVDEVRIVRNPHNGESRGFGFVIMKNESGADEVGKVVCLKPIIEQQNDRS